MRHYTRIDWFLYLEDKLEIKEKEAMEKHLEVCDKCLNSYLSILLAEDVKSANKIVPANFTAKTVKRVQNNERFKKSKAGSNPLSILQYYTIAAAITLLLMSGGWFELFALKVPSTIFQELEKLSKVEEKIPLGWSAKIINKFSAEIDDLTGMRRRAINEKE